MTDIRDDNEEFRNKVERLVGTAILKNDKNYTDDFMQLFTQELAREAREARIDELKKGLSSPSGMRMEYYQKRIKELIT